MWWPRSCPIWAWIGLCVLSISVRPAPLQSHISDTLCSGGAPRLMYVTDVTLMSARLTPAGPANSTRRRVCAVDLVTCLHCHLEVTVMSSQLIGCEHRDPCRCHHLEMREQGRQTDPAVSDCDVGHDLSVTSVGQTLDVRLLFLESISGEILFRVVSKENRFIFTDPGQVIETARFPAAYPAHYVAEYVIQRPPRHAGSAIMLSFTDYFVSPWSLLEVTDARERKVAAYTGDIFRPPITLTNTSRLTLRFHANGRPGAGFRAKFDFISPSETGAPLLPPRTDCGGIVVSTGGAITMLNMTSSGEVWYDCVWLVRARLPAGHAGKLSLRLWVFRDFAPGSQLRIVDGQTTRGATVAVVSESAIGRGEAAEHVIGSDQAFYVHLRAGFRPTSQLAIVYSSFRHGGCDLHQELSCGDGRCIAQFLRCDGFAHCPDRSDEANSCYTYSLSNSLGVQNDDTWTLSPPNFYFPGPSHAVASLESATLSLLAMCFIIVLTMTSAIIFIYSNGRVAERRARNRILQSISNLMRESSVEVVTAAPDEPPDYEPPPDYEQVVHCFTVQKKRKRKRKGKKAAETHHSSHNRRLPRHNTVPSLHHFGDWLRQHTHGRPQSVSPTAPAPANATTTAAAAAAAATTTAAAAVVAISSSPGDVPVSAETPLTVQLPPEKEESAVRSGVFRARAVGGAHCDCAGACGCGVLVRPLVEKHRHRMSIPRSKSADVLSSVLDEVEHSVWGGGGGGAGGGTGGGGGGGGGDRSPPPPYELEPPRTPRGPTPTPIPPSFPSLPPRLPPAPAAASGLSQSPPMSANLPQSLPLSPNLPQSPPLSPNLPQSPPLSPNLLQSPSLSPSLPRSPSLSPSLPRSPSLSPSLPRSPSLSPSLPRSPSLSPSLPRAPSLDSSLSPFPSLTRILPPPAVPNPTTTPPQLPATAPTSRLPPVSAPAAI